LSADAPINSNEENRVGVRFGGYMDGYFKRPALETFTYQDESQGAFYNMTDTKLADEHIDGMDKSEQYDQLVLPEILNGVSAEDLGRLGRKATFKLDLIIMPAMTILYILNYLDRQNAAAANLADITTDLGMSVTQYNTIISILFVGYGEFQWHLLSYLALTYWQVLMQVPSNLFVSKIKYPAVYICSAVCVWGTISACTAAVHSFGGLLACRFFLGFVEAAFFVSSSVSLDVLT
jgi:hypothetical protein